VCTGLGRINRGFEQYIAGLAQQLRQQSSPHFRLEVWTGGKWTMESVPSRHIANLHRNHPLLRHKRNAFLWEQRSFFAGMLPALLRTQPAAIYLGEYQLYCYLYKLRTALRLSYSLVLYTGGQAIPGLFDAGRDFIHHVTDAYLPQCAHLPAHRQWLLPHFMHDDFVYDDAVIAAIQQQAEGRKIVLSVGLLDKATKQMDLLIAAVQQLKEPVYLILLGEASADTESLRQQVAAANLHHQVLMQQVPHQQLGNWYKAADVFVLCSLKESFGLAMVEALYHGLPVICRPFTESKFVLQNQACFTEMHAADALAAAIAQQLSKGTTAAQKAERTNFVLQRYSWQALGPQYQQMLETIAGNSTLISGPHPSKNS
jgi:glycosyltransferase involved in cell wall biosynthesis